MAGENGGGLFARGGVGVGEGGLYPTAVGGTMSREVRAKVEWKPRLSEPVLVGQS